MRNVIGSKDGQDSDGGALSAVLGSFVVEWALCLAFADGIGPAPAGKARSGSGGISIIF
jgi:hypothetical protein